MNTLVKIGIVFAFMIPGPTLAQDTDQSFIEFLKALEPKSSIQLALSQDSQDSRNFTVAGQIPLYWQGLSTSFGLSNSKTSSFEESFSIESYSLGLSSDPLNPWIVELEANSVSANDEFFQNGMKLRGGWNWDKISLGLIVGRERVEIKNYRPINAFNENPIAFNRRMTGGYAEWFISKNWTLSAETLNSSYDRNFSGITSLASTLFFGGPSISMVSSLPEWERRLTLSYYFGSYSFHLGVESSKSQIDNETFGGGSLSIDKKLLKYWLLGLSAGSSKPSSQSTTEDSTTRFVSLMVGYIW